MSKLAYAALAVVILLAIGGFAAYKVVNKAVDDYDEEHTRHAEWDYTLEGQSGFTTKTYTYKIAVKSLEKSDTKEVRVLCSSLQLATKDGYHYSVTSSSGTKVVSVVTDDGYSGMGQGVAVGMKETKTFTVTFQVPNGVTVDKLELSQHGVVFTRNDSLL